MKRILGIDLGKRRIGLAVTDELGITAQGLETLDRDDVGDEMVYLARIVEEREVGEIVVGRPLSLAGRRGDGVRETEKFAALLREHFGLPVHLWDERLSSAQAERAMLDADVSRRNRKKARDRMAAQIILQSFMDARGSREDA